jgi:uncharacterized repeat protein (TIGR03803 family)
MRGKKLSMGLSATLAICTVTLLVTSTWAATEKKLHNFGNGTDGSGPEAGLIFDTAGNLYGTTAFGGNYGNGTVFEMTPNQSGGWTEKTLHSFGNGTGGARPYAGLIFDTAGNLYGTTYYGGDHDAGTVFELTPNGRGGWAEKTLHNFGNGTDGAYPAGVLIFDQNGNLYGTTDQGGDYPCYGGLTCGTVFEVTPNGSGGWTEKKLHNFNKNGDGFYPGGGLIFDKNGNLYGTTFAGGDHNYGTVFELTPNGSGGWTEKKLHNFNPTGKDGTDPGDTLIIDAAGNLYGTTFYGGDYNWGTVFELTPNGSGGWTETKLHNFYNNGANGIDPVAGVIFDTAGNLYGTTLNGGDYGDGTAFELTPNGSGGWTETKLHNFNHGTDGSEPYVGLIVDAAGNLYGTTFYGGGNHDGTVFEITP